MGRTFILRHVVHFDREKRANLELALPWAFWRTTVESAPFFPFPWVERPQLCTMGQSRTLNGLRPSHRLSPLACSVLLPHLIYQRRASRPFPLPSPLRPRKGKGSLEWTLDYKQGAQTEDRDLGGSLACGIG